MWKKTLKRQEFPLLSINTDSKHLRLAKQLTFKIINFLNKTTSRKVCIQYKSTDVYLPFSSTIVARMCKCHCKLVNIFHDSAQCFRFHFNHCIYPEFVEISLHICECVCKERYPMVLCTFYLQTISEKSIADSCEMHNFNVRSINNI